MASVDPYGFGYHLMPGAIMSPTSPNGAGGWVLLAFTAQGSQWLPYIQTSTDPGDGPVGCLSGTGLIALGFGV